MEFIYSENRLYAEDEKGKLLVEATFPSLSETVVCLDHTFVDPMLRGQGMGSMLMEEVIRYTKEQNKKIQPICPFAISWLEKHPEYSDRLVQS